MTPKRMPHQPHPLTLLTANGEADRLEERVKLKGKTIVFWRAIDGRPVEVFGRLPLPKGERAALNYLAENLDKYQREYDSITRYIPEVQDLQKIVDDRGSSDNLSMTEEQIRAANRLFSFDFYCALVDVKSKTVDTIHYGVYSSIFYEFFKREREPEVRKRFTEWMS